MKPLQKLGGSTGATLMLDGKRKKFVSKAGGSPGQSESKDLTNQAYRLMGVPVPQSKIYRTETGKAVLVSDDIEGRTLNEYLNDQSINPQNRSAVIEKLRKHFVMDCLYRTGMSLAFKLTIL